MKKIFIIAGEASGDRLAGELIESLKSKIDVQCRGLGGPLMEKAGVCLLFKLTDLAVVGFFEVIKNIFKFSSVFRMAVKDIKKDRPDCVILVDYPGFNLEFAKKAKTLGLKVIYYVSPQLWAWDRSRIKLIKRYVDKMMVVFDFEKDFYLKYGIDAEFVGHPLLDLVRADIPPQNFRKKIGFDESKTTIALMPGSRKKEIYTLLPLLLKSARLINKKVASQFIFIRSKTVLKDTFVYSLLEKAKEIDIAIIDEEDKHNAIFSCDFAIVASGTATLETALLQTPMVIVYKLNLLSFILARILIKIPYIGLVNVVAGKKVVPELIQFKTHPKQIAKTSLSIIKDNPLHKQILLELDIVKSKLGPPGASARAAKVVADLLSENTA